MEDRRSRRVGSRVSLVLELIDDFTNKTIKASNMIVTILEEKPPLRKEDGYYVFTNLQRKDIHIKIESDRYETKSVHYDLSMHDNHFPAFKVRMYPNSSYPLPHGTACVEGRAEAGSKIRILCKEQDRGMRLIHDYRCDGEHSGEIEIYCSGNIDLEGKDLFIESRDKTEAEFFQVAEQTAENRYLLSRKLKNSYKKIGTVIYQVFSGLADENSFFYIPIENLGKDNYVLCCEASGTVTVQKECRFTAAARNWIELREGDE